MATFKVLLVDDEEDFLELLAMRLRRRKLDVACASDGASALEALDARPADVVVLDMRMPGMDGLETLEHIRRRHPAARVIMLTGFVDADTLEAVLQNGAVDYLTKPVDLDELMIRIEQVRNLPPGRPADRTANRTGRAD